MRHTLAAALLAAALLPAIALHAQPFEGVITLHMGGTNRDGTPLPELEYMSSGGRMRLNARSPMGTMGMIAVPAEKKMYLLMDAQSAYMEQPLSVAAGKASTVPEPTITRTGKKETIAGYECEHVVVAAPEGTTDICMARGLGPFFAATSALGGASLPAWQRALIADGSFPLKVTKADGTVQLEATKIERKKLSDKLFTVPDSYTRMDMPARRL